MTWSTVLVTRHWTLDRPDARARISCDIALVQDDDDRGFYELRIALNREPVYNRVWDSREAVADDTNRIQSDLLNAGWVYARVWCPSKIRVERTATNRLRQGS